MKGLKELYQNTIKLLSKKKFKYNIKDIDKGFEIEISEYPYIFKILCYEKIGWNVYLDLTGFEALTEHIETSKLYAELENIIDLINYNHYGLSKEIEPLVNDSFKELNDFLNEYSVVIDSIEKINLTFNIVFNKVENKTPRISIKYSISNNTWSLDSSGLFYENNIIDSLFEVFDKASKMVQKFNNKIDNLNYYF